MVHSLSTISRQSPSPKWRSSQVITTDKLVNLFFYQCNPSFNDYDLVYSFVDIEKKKIITSKNLKIPKKGVVKVSFKDQINLLKNHNHIQLYANNGLPSPNSKLSSLY